jgi:protein-S-isoprenylcysteine O-methyltransferase Ste14
MSAENPVSIQRGNYNWTLPGPLFLILGRLACIPLQYAIVTSNPLSISQLPRSSTQHPSFLPAWLPALEPLTIFLGMTGVLVVKQGIWAFYISNEHMTLAFAFFGVVADFLYEGVCALVFSVAAANPMWTPVFLYLGAALHFLAATSELAAELQRKRFKDDPKNGGKLCKEGAWGVVRHPNFAMNVVYGAAYGFATGGPLFALLPVGMYLGNFMTNAIPPKEVYLAEKYGEQWEKYRRMVRWKMCPGVY